MGAERFATSLGFASSAVDDASADDVSAAAVSHRHGAPPHVPRTIEHHNHNPIDDSFAPAFQSLYDFGLSLPQVACVFGVSKARTKWLFKRNRIPLRTDDARKRIQWWRVPKERAPRAPAKRHVKDEVPDRRRKLMPAHVVMIRLLAADGIKQRALAQWFGVTAANIHHVVCGRNHRRIKRAQP